MSAITDDGYLFCNKCGGEEFDHVAIHRPNGVLYRSTCETCGHTEEEAEPND